MNKLIFIIGEIFNTIFQKLVENFLMLFLTSILSLGVIWIISYTLELNDIKERVEYQQRPKPVGKVISMPAPKTFKDSLYVMRHKYYKTEAETDAASTSSGAKEVVSWIKELLTWLIGFLNGVVGLIYMVRKIQNEFIQKRRRN